VEEEGIAAPFRLFKQKGRKNLLNYNFILYKLLQLIDRQDTLCYFPQLKTRAKWLELDCKAAARDPGLPPKPHTEPWRTDRRSAQGRGPREAGGCGKEGEEGQAQGLTGAGGRLLE
jgi:hypothetical protein